VPACNPPAPAPHICAEISIPFFEPLTNRDHIDRLLAALSLTAADLDAQCPLAIAKRTSTRLMVGLTSVATLTRIVPNLEALKTLSHDIGADGYFLFVRNSRGQGTADTRLFAPALGIAEDVVSGNAHGMLGAYVVVNRLLPGLDPEAAAEATFVLRGFQGESMKRPGEVEVRVTVVKGVPQSISIGGTGRVLFAAEVALE
jgi:PhzF family phenazine biosynthesis protein